MRVRMHKGFGHGLRAGTDHDLNCGSCKRERAEGTPPQIEKDGRVAVLVTVPSCDISPAHGEAYADAAIPGGPWGYVCRGCFDKFGCSLGTGAGQMLVRREES